jgi:hypothetical protein
LESRTELQAQSNSPDRLVFGAGFLAIRSSLTTSAVTMTLPSAMQRTIGLFALRVDDPAFLVLQYHCAVPNFG